MAHDNFLNPHLDNSHDKDRQMYRVLNLLYYVTPDWDANNGGNLELWDNGPKEPQRTIHSKFNRLALMATHTKSWHSVSKVTVDRSRCCVSNYYFSEKPLEDHAYFHVTSFRGRPEQPIRDVVLQSDKALRQGVRRYSREAWEQRHTFTVKRKQQKLQQSRSNLGCGRLDPVTWDPVTRELCQPWN